MKRYILLSLLFILVSGAAKATGPVPFFRNFTPSEYDARSQNWSLAQDSRGFSYGDVTLSSSRMRDDGTVTASVTVTNTGERDGKEVVQLYVRDIVGSVTRPVKELKGFKKVFIRAGETASIGFEIGRDMLGFYDGEGNFITEKGEFQIFIGGSSTTSNSAILTLE